MAIGRIRLRYLAFCATSALVGAICIACGEDSASPGNGPGDGADGGDAGTSPTPDGGSPFGDGGGGPVGGGRGSRPVCANKLVQASRAYVNVIVQLDHSGSMGNTTSDPNLDKRWCPIVEALNIFFSSRDNAGMSASLRVYPQPRAPTEVACKPETYQRPDVDLQPLPTSAFSTFLSRTEDPVGGSAVKPGLEGGLLLAKDTIDRHVGDKTVVVLVTDGLPADPSAPSNCGSTYENLRDTAAAAFKGSPSIPTHVIAVGNEADRPKLEAIAAQGGTERAIWLDVGVPQSTSIQLTNALDKGRLVPLACRFTPPTAPPGKQLDPNAVDVTLTRSNVPAKLAYDASCAAAGWRYDNPRSPSNIELCPATCDSVKTDATAKVSVDFACIGN